MKILVADDDKNLRKILRTELSEGGFSVDVAGSGTTALDLLVKNDYDVLLLDLNMPGLDGMDVLEKVKAGEAPIEIIVLTGLSSISTADLVLPLICTQDYIAGSAMRTGYRRTMQIATGDPICDLRWKLQE